MFLRYYRATLCEKNLGKAFKALNVPRSDYIVSTKCGRYKDGFDFSAERVAKSIEESLERLELDYVDILQCNDIEFASLHQETSVLTDGLLKHANLVRYAEHHKTECIDCSSTSAPLSQSDPSSSTTKRGPSNWNK